MTERVLSLSRRILRAVVLALIIASVAAVASYLIVAFTKITYAMLGEWAVKFVAPAGVLWAFAEKKVREWKKDESDQRALRAAEEAAVAAKVLAAQEHANEERARMQESLESVIEKVEHIAEQVGMLVKDGQNNDGSSARDRNDLVFSEVKSIATLLASTTARAIWWAIVNRDGVVIPTRVSDKFARLTGLSHEQTRNNGWINFVHPSDQTRVEETVSVAMRKGRPFEIDYLGTHCLRDEPDKHIRHSGTPTTNPQTDKVIGWTWELTDLTEANRRATDTADREVEP